jgi:hypothetical protein
MARATAPHGQRLSVGDHVVLTLAGRELDATVIEDRGPLGVGGRQIVGIRLGEGDDAREFEVAAEHLALRAAA